MTCKWPAMLAFKSGEGSDNVACSLQAAARVQARCLGRLACACYMQMSSWHRLQCSMFAGSSVAAADTVRSDGLGSSMVLRLHGLSLHNRAAGSYGALSMTMQLKGLNLDVIHAPVRDGKGKTLNLWHFRLYLHWFVTQINSQEDASHACCIFCLSHAQYLYVGVRYIWLLITLKELHPTTERVA